MDVYWALGAFFGVAALVAVGIYLGRRRDELADQIFDRLEAQGAEALGRDIRGVRFDDGLELWQDFYGSARAEKLEGKLPLPSSVPFFYIGSAANITPKRPDLNRPLTPRSSLPNVAITDESMGRTFYLFSKSPQAVAAAIPDEARRELANLERDFDMWFDKRTLVFVAAAINRAEDEARVNSICTLLRSIREGFFPPPEPEPEPEPEPAGEPRTRLPGEPTYH